MGGAAFGFVMLCWLITTLKDDVDAQLDGHYQGWPHFVVLTLGPPFALLSGFLLRNKLKYAVMLATSAGGAVIFVVSIVQALGCAQVDIGSVARRQDVQGLILVLVTVLGLVVQAVTDKSSSGPSKRAVKP